MRWGGELFWGAWKKLEGFCSLAGVAGPTRPSISSQAGPGLPLHWAAASWPSFCRLTQHLRRLTNGPTTATSKPAAEASLHRAPVRSGPSQLPPPGTASVADRSPCSVAANRGAPTLSSFSVHLNINTKVVDSRCSSHGPWCCWAPFLPLPRLLRAACRAVSAQNVSPPVSCTIRSAAVEARWPRRALQLLTRGAVESYYVSKTEFTCVTDASIKLSWDRVNDNTCDCPDGSDEPGTAACAYLDPLSPQQPLPGSPSGSTSTKNALPGFWCVNKGHIGSYVPFVYVNDGVCDYDLCCDGSEEFAGVGGIKCENRCDEIGKEHRKLEEEKRKNMEKAEKKRKTMAKEAKELRRRVEVRLADHIDEIKELEAKKADLQKKLAAVELQEKGKVVRGEGGGGKLGVLVGVAKTRVNELRNTLDGVLQQRNHLRAQVDELETILRKFKEEYNPNFNDEGVKAAVKSFEDYSARQETDVKDQIPDSEIEEVLKEDSDTIGVNWKEFEELGDDTDIRKCSDLADDSRPRPNTLSQCTISRPTCQPSFAT